MPANGSTTTCARIVNLSYFHSKNDNQPRHTEVPWAAFCAELAQPIIRAAKDGPLFSPATFNPAKRLKANVTEISALVLDYDHQANLAEDLVVWAELGRAYAIYTSHSHRRVLENNPHGEDRFRVVLPLAVPIPAAQFPALWVWASQQSGGRIDAAAKDASRIYYRPARFAADAPYEWHVAEGEWLDWRTLDLPAASADVRTNEANGASGAGQSARSKAPQNGRTAYGETALQDWLGKLCVAPEGARNDTLNRAAYYLGQCVGGGHLLEAEVRTELARVAKFSGLTESEIAATLDSGLHAGMLQPRNAAPRKPAAVATTAASANATGPLTQELTADDRLQLERSYITAELAARAGVRRVDSETGAVLLGRHVRAGYAGLIFPYRWPGEEGVREYRLWRDAVAANGASEAEPGSDKQKFLAGHQQGHALYFGPSAAADWLREPRVPAVITLGELATLALTRFFAERDESRLVMGLASPWAWRGPLQPGNNAAQSAQHTIIADFERLEWNGREVELVFDLNTQSSASGGAARRDLAAELIRRGAVVRTVDLPEKGSATIDALLDSKGPAAAAEVFTQARLRVAKRQVRTMAGNLIFTVDEKGVHAHDTEHGDKLWICSPLYVEADTRDEHGERWGRLLRFPDADGRMHRWAMPLSLLSGDGGLYRERLLDQGVTISPMSKAKNFLGFYLSTQPDRRVRCVDKVGWNRGAYIFPDETIGASDGEEVHLQAQQTNHLLRTGGTLDDWREAIAHYCIGNSRLLFAVSLAFGAALLDLVGEESGGFHFRGGSSVGKTTAQYVAGSVWGGGSDRGFLKRWRATIHGLEGVAEYHNDGLLCLDELAECDPREVGNAAYMLANGQGKFRMQRTTTLRPVLEWRLFFLSSGEIRLSDHMAQAGQRVKAGQEVRFVNLEADAGNGCGLFDELHGFSNGAAFSKHLVDMSKRLYGAAIRAFVRAVITNQVELKRNARAFMNRFEQTHVPAHAVGEVRRVARRFALVAFAGEFAAAEGLTGWPANEATAAAERLFAEWLADRGTSGSSDSMTALHQVRAFLEQHGASRFQGPGDTRVQNRAGFKVLDADGAITEYQVMPETFRREICAGHDPETVARALATLGYLNLANSQKKGYTTQRRQAEFGRRLISVYAINPGIFSHGGEEDE